MTEPLKELNVAQTVRHAGGISQRYLAPHEIVRAVERDERRETNSVGEVGEILHFVELGKESFIAVVDLVLVEVAHISSSVVCTPHAVLPIAMRL